jgi:hypothetical protein
MRVPRLALQCSPLVTCLFSQILRGSTLIFIIGAILARVNRTSESKTTKVSTDIRILHDSCSMKQLDRSSIALDFCSLAHALHSAVSEV